jgi:hypothetical protein
MRIVVAIIVVGCASLIGVRLVAALDELRAMVTALSRGTAVPAPLELVASSIDSPREMGTEGESPQPSHETSAVPSADVGSHDARIMGWLAQEPELERAASDLLNDPNPVVRREAAELLRALGVVRDDR